MAFINSHILSLILFFPVLGALALLLIPKTQSRTLKWAAFAFSLVPFLLTLYAWGLFKQSAATQFRLEELAPWFSAIHSSYHLGIDGISFTMILLTTLLVPLAILTAFSVGDRIKAFMVLFLLLETGLLGVFLSLDLILFFVFWEIGLVPMYFLIAQWGGEKRNYASLKFILFTMGGSLGLLLAIQMIGSVTGTFDLPTLLQTWPALNSGTLFGLPWATVKAVAFWAFVIAFAIKVPVWPFHTWLPDAHTEAPTAGSMILAGVMLKLGAYGFIRLVLPLFPVEAAHYAVWLAILAAAAIIFGALSASAQTDFKRLVAYSSINHMGFVILGVAAAAWAAGSTDPLIKQSAVIAMDGAVLQMFNHGLSAAGMFFLVGVLYERTHTRDLSQFGGLFAILPVYGTILMVISMASVGLPGMGGFISEFLVVRGAWPIFMAVTAISLIGLFFTGVYVLKALRLVLHGPLNKQWAGHISEIQTREIFVVVPLMVLLLLTGIWPQWILGLINQAVVAWF